MNHILYKITNSMAATKGNRFWELRAKHGRDKLFESPQLLWEAACEYFEWCEENPLKETKGFAYQGVVVKEEFPKMRAMTLGGLCLYLDCTPDYFRAFKNQKRKNAEDFIPIIHKIEQTLYNQKFEGAAADLLNANIIARDLGLVDKRDIETGGKSLSPFAGMSTEDLIKFAYGKDEGSSKPVGKKRTSK